MAGLTMKIKNNKAADIWIEGEPFDTNTYYYVVNPDYIVNRGAGMPAWEEWQRALQ